VVVLPGANQDVVRELTFGQGFRLYTLDPAGAGSALASKIDDLHYYR
jgi:hypothetical protein